MKYILGSLIIFVLLVGYFINKSNNEDMARLKKAEVAQKQKIQDEKYAAELEIKVKEFQSKVSIDSSEAKQIIESDKVSDDAKKFYAIIGGQWSDGIKVAASTSRIALAQPVAELQRIRNQLEARQTTNYCDQAIKKSLYISFDYAIDGFLAFMQNNDYSSETNSELSSKYMDKALIIKDYCYK